MVRHGERDDFLMIGGKIQLSKSTQDLLLDELPAFIRVPAQSPHARPVQWLLEQLVAEREGLLLGSDVATTQLAQLMFLHILRAHFASSVDRPSGWVRAATDPRIAPTLRLMHAEPGRNSQLDELAKEAAISRATFATYFKAVAGIPPLAYLTRWRMQLARRELSKGHVTVAEVACNLGYASESSFSHAFKRVLGCSPSEVRDEAKRDRG